MRYNVFDLYEGSVRGDKLKEVALKLDYAKPAKGQGVNGNNEDIDEAKLLSGLNPSILSLLKFEVKFKNMDNATISELIQDVNFKNAIFNVAVNAARLEKLFGELKQLHFKEEEIKEAILELKELVEKEKQAEKERTQQDVVLRQQIEAQNQELQRMMNEYMKQRAEKIRALEDTIKELNAKQKELIAYDKEILKEYSGRFADNLDNFKNDKGESPFANLSKEQKHDFSQKVFDDFYKIERKYDKKREQIDQRIAEIDKELSSPQNGRENDKSTSNKGSGSIISTAFQRHTDNQVPIQRKAELEKEKKQLQEQRAQLSVSEDQEKIQVVEKRAQESGVPLSKKEAGDFKVFVEKSPEYKAQVENRIVVEKQMESVANALVKNKSLLEHETEALDTMLHTEEVQNVYDQISNLISDEEELDLSGIDNIDDIDLSGVDEGLDEALAISSEFSEQPEDSSASLRTKLN